MEGSDTYVEVSAAEIQVLQGDSRAKEKQGGLPASKPEEKENGD
jgi:hypothetical protein